MLTLGIIGFLIYGVYKIGLDTFSSQDKLITYIEQFGVYAPIVYFLLQFTQILFAPIPGNITGLAGGLLFGPFYGSILGILATIAGSTVMFFIGRKYGKKALKHFTTEENYQKYERRLSGKGAKTVLLGVFILPFMPDDAICLLAGIGEISFKDFLLLMAVGRIPSIIITTAMGAGLYTNLKYIVAGASLLFYLIVFVVYRYIERAKGISVTGQGDDR